MTLYDVEVHFKNRSILPLRLEASTLQDVSNLLTANQLHYDYRTKTHYAWSLTEVVCLQIRQSEEKDATSQGNLTLDQCRTDILG